MILPLRVFGRLSPKRMSFGLAIAPISLPTHSRSSRASFCAASPVGRACLSTTKAQIARGGLVGTADHRRLGHSGLATSADSISIVPMRWPETFSTSSMRPTMVK